MFLHDKEVSRYQYLGRLNNWPQFRLQPHQPAGMMQAWVAHFVMSITPL